jgi:parvulin-like peptidyl-prolyl isomerase
MRGNDYMSASNKKKLRKEQNVAAMTEKQLNEQKEAKKLKTYTWTFVIAMILVVVIAIGSVIRLPIIGALNRSHDAIKIGGHTLTTTDLSYYYVDAINDHYNQAYQQYGNYAALLMGFDTSKPLNEQKYGASEDFETWADYFMDKGIENAKAIYGLYNDAVANNHTLTEDEQKTLDAQVESIATMAKYYGYSSANAYLRATYGTGANQKTYAAYYTVNTIASSYYNAHSESLKYTNEDFRAFEKDKMHDYNSYSYGSYTFIVNNFLKGGTKGEDGKITYSDAEKAQAEKDAKAAAEALAKETFKDYDAFEKAIKALEINKDKKDVAVNKYENNLYKNLTLEDLKKWLAGDRKAGDMTVIDVTTTTKDTNGKEVKNTTGFTVYFFMEGTDNKTALVDVRHILVKFSGGKTTSDGNVVYTEAEKTAAKNAAQAILDEWKKGAATEESFAELAKSKSQDGGSKDNGGLYEKIYPGMMVTNFNDWCFDSTRKTGDTGLISTDYGYHVMYYVKANEQTFRDYMIENQIRADDMEAWKKALTEKVTVEEIDLSRMNWEYKFG